MHSQLSKSLDDVELPKKGSELESWKYLLEKSQDMEWKGERLKRDEKFDMHLKALVCMLALSRVFFCSNLTGITSAKM